MTRHILVAPDKFKGSLTATDAARAITRGLLRFDASIRTIECPIADGGEGTLSAAVAAGFVRIPVDAPGPTGRTVSTAYARRGTTAVVEMADVVGLQRLPGGTRQPMTASSRGLGHVIAHALDDGCRHIVLGIGGSASTDGGAGFLQALGAKLLDEHGRPLGDGGRALLDACALDVSALHSGLQQATVVIACDVDNPLCGPGGAAAVYGTQKGANSTQVEELDAALEHWAALVDTVTETNARGIPGAGAAGGVGFAAMAVLGAELRSGIDLILDMVGLDRHLHEAAAIITGEGSLDRQSLHGKAPVGARLRASAHGVPAYAIVGVSTLSREEEAAAQFAAIYSLHDREPDLARSIAGAGNLLTAIAQDLAAEHFATSADRSCAAYD
ncbi:glycerate kinase [Rhodococcus sp. ACPA1]|uniref:glycerate kinase n=1 Tax=Rhodococcus sp. ACPA1 TaxID=2028572 RepID=UPI000BB12AF2|nr:glycerate kinase [Rhodococcus sp. ACPA1]PBC47155.1 glycerate kinase [Rhodococcus sp. ACPA1]